MNYLKTPENAWILDLEADDLKATKIWVVIVKSLSTGEVLEFYNKEEFNVWYKPEFTLIGHNILSYDIPVLNRLWGTDISLYDCIDTLVLSYLYNPTLDGGHSLEAWGQRLNLPKGQFSDWSKLSPKMVLYCKQDVAVTEKLYHKLTERMRKYGFSEKSCEIEHKIRIIINEQQEHGFWFDRKRAEVFCDFLRGEESRLSEVVRKLFPPRREKVAEYTLRRRKDGSPYASYETHRYKYSDIVEYESSDITSDHEGLPYYECYELVPFNLGSPKQRIQRLLELGWEPTVFTKKGNPKIDEDALLAYAQTLPEGSGRAAIEALAEYLVVKGRLSMVAGNPDTGSLGWLGNVGPDSRIHGRVNSCGAGTRRMIHSNPNTANIPSGAKAKYGHECRSFWTVSNVEKLVLVGYDAAGLETAGLCHYLNNEGATEALLRAKPNDIHTVNAQRLTEALKRPIDREWGAKTSWYAWLYGAFPPKLGSIVKGPPSDGEIIIETFFRNVPGLKKLIEDIQYEFRHNNGRLETIDGGLVWCPSLGAALNYKIQSAGTIVCKLAAILLDEERRKQKLPFWKVGDIHDEGQLECIREEAVLVGNLAVDCISRAGCELGFRVALTGDFKIGETWAETH